MSCFVHEEGKENKHDNSGSCTMVLMMEVDGAIFLLQFIHACNT